MSRRYVGLPGGVQFDERRNTSRTFGVEPGALDRALRHLAASSRQDWYQWVLAWGRQEHRHDLHQADGRPAACPVRGCRATWEGM